MGFDTTKEPDLTQPALHGRVLIADDSTSNLLLLRHQLEHLGLEVTSALNGREVLEAARTSSYHLILMDLSMPHMDGMEAVQALRASQISTPVIALSGQEEAEGKDTCLDAGFDDFWEKKGYTEEQLYERLTPFFKCIEDTNRCSSESSDNLPDSETVPAYSLERLTQAYGSQEVALQIIHTFLQDAVTIEEGITQAIEAGDYEAVVGLAHKLAGAAGMIQAAQLGDLATQLESAAASGDKILIARCFSRLQLGYERLCSLIQNT